MIIISPVDFIRIKSVQGICRTKTDRSALCATHIKWENDKNNSGYLTVEATNTICLASLRLYCTTDGTKTPNFDVLVNVPRERTTRLKEVGLSHDKKLGCLCWKFTREMASNTEVRTMLMKGIFPDFASLIDTKEPQHKIRVNGKELARLARAAGDDDLTFKINIGENGEIDHRRPLTMEINQEGEDDAIAHCVIVQKYIHKTEEGEDTK